MYLYHGIIAGAFPLLSGYVNAHTDSSLASRQAGPSTNNCNATCAVFANAKANCNTPHCGCTVPFVQAQGECLLCHTVTPKDQATVQFLLDAEIAQCHTEKIKINFQLDLPPAAAAIVQKFNHDSATLRREQSAFLGFQIAGGHIGLVFVLAVSIFSNEIHRDPTFINFCITWIFSSIVLSLFLYRGTADNTPINPLGIVSPDKCVAQAALAKVHSSTLALIIQLWIILRIAIHGDIYGITQTRWVTGVLLVTPYILFVVFTTASGFVGMDHIIIENTSLQRASPMNFYCIVIRLNSFLQSVHGVTVALLILTLVFDALVIRVLYTNWRAFRQVKAKSAVGFSVLLRFIAFSIYRVVVSVAYLSTLSKLPELNSTLVNGSLPSVVLIPTWVDMLQAAIPFVAFLLLGVNEKLMLLLMFWRWFRPRTGPKPASLPSSCRVETPLINSATT